MKTYLTQQEYDVWKLLASGLLVKEAASVMDVSNVTVDRARRRIYGMLGVNNRAGLLFKAIECGLVEVKVTKRLEMQPTGKTSCYHFHPIT